MAKQWAPHKILLGLCATKKLLSDMDRAHFSDIVTAHPPPFHPIIGVAQKSKMIR
jgi:hypothetical protein